MVVCLSIAAFPFQVKKNKKKNNQCVSLELKFFIVLSRRTTRLFPNVWKKTQKTSSG